MSDIGHTLKEWEKKYGYIKLIKGERQKLSNLKEKAFIVKIGENRLLDRKIDLQNRIYLGITPLRDFKVGDKLIISPYEEGLIMKKGE